MGRRKRNQAQPQLGDLSDPRSLAVKLGEYLEWMRVKNYSERTVEDREKLLGGFIAWCQERGVCRVSEVTRPILERYQKRLYYHRKEDGRPLSFRSQCTRLVTVRGFFKWLTRHNHILYNPASEVELPRIEKRLPKHVLSAGEVEQVLRLAQADDVFGLRDRAILEVLYSTGIRRKEVIGLQVYDVDAEREALYVRQGKGKKDRVVPMGERALKWVDKYLRESRPQLAMGEDEGVLFLTRLGRGFSRCAISCLVRRYVGEAKLGKAGACHIFRHTMATLMLENGADIRYVQEMLGHEKLETTQIYTHVSLQKLKEIHRATHPARMSRGTTNLDDPQPSNPEADELLSSLAAEAEREANEQDEDI